MKQTLVLFFFCLLAIVVVASARHSHESLVDLINSNPEIGWTADPNHKFFSRFNGDDNRVKRLLGVLPSSQRLPELSAAERGIPSDVGAPPASFDARDQWPGCVGAIRNQGDCGSCWAFGGVEALSDRFCIASKGSVNVTLAPLDPVSCDAENDGCEGGQLFAFWQYAKNTGVVLETCAPYNESIPTCPPAQQPCLNFVPTPKCTKQCSDGSSWTESKHHAQSAYAVSSNVVDIQTEIMTNGPVEAAFTVYEDFLAYKTGVYKHVKGNAVGGHAIKIVGWGTENGTDYWTIANSWTDLWGGLDGYFLMLRGTDECGIESNIVAGLPKL